MNELDFFEDTSIQLIDNEVFASRLQLQDLYDVPKKTLADNINQLKSDGLIVGAEIRPKFRLRSEIALKFKKWAREIIKQKLLKAIEDVRRTQIMESIAWNHLDARDNHR